MHSTPVYHGHILFYSFVDLTGWSQGCKVGAVCRWVEEIGSVSSVRSVHIESIIDIIAPSVPLSLWPQPLDFYIFYFLDLFPHHTSIGHAKNRSYRTTVSNKPGNANICGDCSRRFCGASLQTVDAVLVRLVLCCWCREASIL